MWYHTEWGSQQYDAHVEEWRRQCWSEWLLWEMYIGRMWRELMAVKVT